MEEGEPEPSSSEKSGHQEEEEEEEEEAERPKTKPNDEISEYEQQRLARIRENKARLQALGLPSLASSILGPPSKRQQSTRANKGKAKKKKKGEEDDDEYRPSDEEDRGEKHAESCFSSEQEEEEQEDVGVSSSSRRKGKRKSSLNAAKAKKKLHIKGDMEEYNHIDEDAALQQAIALSLGRSTEDLTAVTDMVSSESDRKEAGARLLRKKEKANARETAPRRKSNKVTKSRVQLTEDEVVAYFFSFDEAGKGYISLRDLQRMVATHDFNWTDSEVSSMIHSFDSGRTGKLSLEDFRTIVSRCNMLQESGNC